MTSRSRGCANRSRRKIRDGTARPVPEPREKERHPEPESARARDLPEIGGDRRRRREGFRRDRERVEARMEYETLSPVRPRCLVLLLRSPVTAAGPMRDVAGHDVNYLSYAGLASPGALRAAGRCSPSSWGSLGGSMMALSGILMARIPQRRWGVDRHLDADGSSRRWRSRHPIFWWGNPQERAPCRWPGCSRYDTYRCADGGYVSLAR